MVERLPLGPAGGIGDKRDRRVHHAQIIDQKDDEVGLGGRGGERKTEEEEGDEGGAGAGLGKLPVEPLARMVLDSGVEDWPTEMFWAGRLGGSLAALSP
jgi:uncharacterized spore protein YtfJ